MIDWQPTRRRPRGPLTGWRADLAEFASLMAAIFITLFLIGFLARVARIVFTGA